MAGERRLRILTLLANGEAGITMPRVCGVCATATGTTGAGMMLISDDMPRGSICTTDDVSGLIERLQYDLGEGPCLDAHRLDSPVHEPDLANPAVVRWPAFSEPVLAAGARAVFAFPLRVGSVRLGAMHVYEDRPGPLSDEQHADALVMAEVAAQSVLMLQAGAPPDVLARELAAGADFRYVVHQAAGMASVQLDVSIAEALVRLRAHAFGNGRPLTDVAADVVARRLRFHPDDAEPTQREAGGS